MLMVAKRSVAEAAKLRVFRLDRERAQLPHYATAQAAGLDLHCASAAPITLASHAWQAIPTGLAMAIPQGFEGQVRPRSGLAAKHGITLLNSPGTIDADYRGEVKVLLINLGPEPYTVQPGDRIAQLVIAPCIQAQIDEVNALEALGDSERGSGGFGSTGK